VVAAVSRRQLEQPQEDLRRVESVATSGVPIV
jgi:hypothetical protein